jgi:site-specific DNA-methyltransferase (adenine-specific)
MELIPLSLISTTDRQRKFFPLDKLIDLAEDIRRNGLLHAPVLQSESFELLAGERRLRAIEIVYDTGGQFMYAGELIPPGMVPVTRAHSRDALGWQEAELSENLARQDLTWQERAQALLRLDALRKAQNPRHTQADTIAEVRETLTKAPAADDLRDDLLLAQHLSDEDVAKQKNRKDAMRVLQRKATLAHAARLGQAFTESARSQSPHTPLQGNCRTILPTLPRGSFDLILTDPPYGIDATEHSTQNRLGHSYDDSYASWRDLMLWFAKESWLLAGPLCHMYVFCDIERWFELRTIIAAEGWRVWRRPLLWWRGPTGIMPRPEHGPRNTYDAILYANKGDKKVHTIGAPDIIHVPAATLGRVHGAEKPVNLYAELMKRSCLPGESVLDPFMGSGTVFPAANVCKLMATGIEQDPSFFGIATTRLERLS